MAIVSRYIGSNGEILIPVTSSEDNSGALISTHGTYFYPQLQTAPATIVAGNPIGLLLALTYSATP